MKFGEFSQPVLDLSDRPSVTIVNKLKKNDLVVYEGEEWKVEVPPKKSHKGVWIVGLTNGKDDKYIKIVEDVKPKMTAHEKKRMVENIKGHVENLYGVNDTKLIEMIPNYHHNLSVYNNYDDGDVRECMAHFPVDLLKRSGVVL